MRLLSHTVVLSLSQRTLPIGSETPRSSVVTVDTARVTPSGVSLSISLLVLCEEHTDWFLP